MKNIRLFLFWTVFLVLTAALQANPLYSPSWGFRLDLPEGYELQDGDGKDRFSFVSSFGTLLDIAVYTGKPSAEALAVEIETKLSARGERHSFQYNGKNAVLSSLTFPHPGARGERFSGWALYTALHSQAGAPLLFVLSYGRDTAFESFHLSILDSVAPAEDERLLPGPVTEFSCPQGAWERRRLAGTEEEAWFREGGPEAAQALVDREFAVLKRYAGSPLWREAWRRFYRAIYRDSFDRLKNAAFILERSWNGGTYTGDRGKDARSFAEKALRWIQGFSYERALLGSDFINLVTAIQEGRGDCDSRAMLWAVLLEQAGVRSGIMVSREFSHAMGMADIEGAGARFPFSEGNEQYRWIVAETTDHVAIGLIKEQFSEISKWLGIVFN